VQATFLSYIWKQQVFPKRLYLSNSRTSYPRTPRYLSQSRENGGARHLPWALKAEACRADCTSISAWFKCTLNARSWRCLFAHYLHQHGVCWHDMCVWVFVIRIVVIVFSVLRLCTLLLCSYFCCFVLFLLYCL
jgi:hypothetical protein